MTTSPFDASPARRPTLEDLGGGAKIDGPVKPDKVTMLTADDMNQWGNVGTATGAVCPLAIVVVTNNAGTYSVTGVRAPGTGIVAGSFTPTKNATGDVTLAWTAGVLPGTISSHASLQGGAGAYREPEVDTTATSVRVRMTDGTGAAVDCSYTVWIY